LHYRFPHEAINHSKGEHVMQGVVGAIRTQTIEGFWSPIKRGVVGLSTRSAKVPAAVRRRIPIPLQ
jgi:hypothetical protein